MSFEIILLLLVAATLHAVWNSIVKGAGDGVVMASWVYCGGGVLLAPALLILPPLPAEGWLLVSIHFCLHMIYKMLLINMYRLGDFSRVFPVARGIAPALVTLAAIPIAGELPPPVALAGVAVICFGLVMFAAERSAFQRAGFQAFALSAGAGIVLSIYTIVDALGVRLEEGALTYVVMLFAVDGLGMAILGFWWRGKALLPAMAQVWKTGISSALMATTNFSIALWVISFTPVGPVSAVRETSIVIAAIIGVVFFKESFGARRIVAACIILAGIVLLNLAG